MAGSARVIIVCFVCALSGLMTGCASGPIAIDEDASSLTVREVRDKLQSGDAQPQIENAPMLWGGVILNVQNLASKTQIEIMAYPLDRRQRPMTGRDALGRFIAVQDAFLEPVDFAQGRSITVLGTVKQLIEGQVGEARYHYPLLQIDALHLWRAGEVADEGGVNFGIGISIGL